MRTNAALAIASIITFNLIGCNDPNDSDSDWASSVALADSVPLSPGPAPVRSPAACRMEFGHAYLRPTQPDSGAVPLPTNAFLFGNLPGLDSSWQTGFSISDTSPVDGYFEIVYGTLAVGTYNVSYKLTANVSANDWATFGSRSHLHPMSAAARSWINCNWWDPVARREITPPGGRWPSCNLQMTVAANCAVTPAGNMANWTGAYNPPDGGSSGG